MTEIAHRIQLTMDSPDNSLNQLFTYMDIGLAIWYYKHFDKNQGNQETYSVVQDTQQVYDKASIPITVQIKLLEKVKKLAKLKKAKIPDTSQTRERKATGRRRNTEGIGKTDRKHFSDTFDIFPCPDKTQP